MTILRQKFFSISGIFRFPPGTANHEIIDHILSDFALKLYGIMKLYKSPKIGCSSLSTYDIFRNFWGINDVLHDGEEIYSEIPSDIIAKKVEELSNGRITRGDVKESFGGGEFPIVKIWKDYHKGKDEIHVTYDIMR